MWKIKIYCKIYEISEFCNISSMFLYKFFSSSDISVTFEFYNVLINRQKALKGAFDYECIANN